MALTSEEKIDIMKQAYLDDYQGSFTDLFIQADPNSLEDDPTMSPSIQPDLSQMPTSAPLPPDPVTNPGVGDMSPISSAQGLVQSYESAPPTEVPRGEGIVNTIDQPMSYKKGGPRMYHAGGLYHNINHKKKSGTSRSKSNSTISDKAYANMKAGFPKKKSEGGYRVADMLNLDYKPSKPNAKEYIKNYLNNKYGDGGPKVPSEDAWRVSPREGEFKNNDSNSTHLMRTETIDGINWVSFPTLFQNADGTWVDMSEQAKTNWQSVASEANKRGELTHFGADKEKALKFGKGSWK